MRASPSISIICLVFLGGCAASPAGGPVSAEPRGAGDLPEGRIDLTADPAPGGVAASLAIPARSGNPWMDCYRSFQPSDDPAVDLSRLTAACGARAGLEAVTSIHVGSQSEDAPPERLKFRARRGHCYRAFAVGAPSVGDLDIAVFDPQHNLVAGDLSHDRWPIVPPRGPLCAPRSGLYTIEIAVAQGSGDYLFQVWGSRSDDEDDEDGAE